MGSCRAAQELSSGPRDGLEGWDQGREGDSRGSRRVYIQLIHAVIEQKVVQHCKAIILQLKKKKKLGLRICPKPSGLLPRSSTAWPQSAKTAVSSAWVLSTSHVGPLPLLCGQEPQVNFY